MHLIIRVVAIRTATSRLALTGSRLLAVLLITAAAALLNVRTSAQGGGARPPDIAGEWRLDQGEDPGQPSLSDYLGLAFNEAGRPRAGPAPEPVWGAPASPWRPPSAPHPRRGGGGTAGL